MLRIALCDDEWEVREAFRLQLEKVLIEGSEEIVYFVGNKCCFVAAQASR